MSGRCTVFIGDGDWRVGCVGEEGARVQQVACPSDAGMAVKAQAVAESVAELQASGPVMVALPSAWCLSAAVDASGVSRSGRAKALAYQLEEHLPISAEESIADFVGSGSEVLGVAAPLTELEDLVKAFESSDLQVAHLCPSALLAAQRYASKHPDARGVVLIPTPAAGASASGREADFIRLSRSGPSRWQWWSDQAETIAEQITASLVPDDGNKPWVVAGEASAIQGIAPVVAAGQDAEQAAVEQAAAILAGDAGAWINLRRGTLAAPGADQFYLKQLGPLAAAAMLLLVSVIAATVWRGAAYQRLADEAVDQQRTVFEDVLPGQRVPGSIRRRLKSERQTLAGLGGRAPVRADVGGETLYPTSALTHLHEVLDALPRGARYQVSDLAIEPGRVRIDGKAESHVVAEQLAGALRSGGKYEVTPPNSRALSGFGVSFGFTARPQPDPEQNQEASP